MLTFFDTNYTNPLLFVLNEVSGNIGIFFVPFLTTKVFLSIKSQAQSEHFDDFIIQGYDSAVDCPQFQKLAKK